MMNDIADREARESFRNAMRGIFEPKKSDCPKCDNTDFVSIQSAVDNAKSFFIEMTHNEKFEIKACALLGDEYRMVFNTQRSDGSIASYSINVDARSGKVISFCSC